MTASGARTARSRARTRGEPAAPDQREGEERAEHAARADGCVQDADARSPVSSRSIARTTVNTVRRPRVNVWTTPSAVISDSVRSPAMVAKPWTTSRPADPRRCPPGAARRRGGPRRPAAPSRDAAAHAANTAPARSRRGARPRPPDRRGWRASPASRAPRSRSSGPRGTWPARGAGPNAPAGRAPQRPSRRWRTHTSRPRSRQTPLRPRHARASRHGPPRSTSEPARDEPGRPASQGTAREAQRSPCGPR